MTDLRCQFTSNIRQKSDQLGCLRQYVNILIGDFGRYRGRWLLSFWAVIRTYAVCWGGCFDFRLRHAACGSTLNGAASRGYSSVLSNLYVLFVQLMAKFVSK